MREIGVGLTDEVLLVGIEDALPYFEKNAKSDPGAELLVVSKERRIRVSLHQATRVKKKLIVRYWRLSYFLNQQTRP